LDPDGNKTKFVVSDEHSNITACPLPEWLPGEIVHAMVVEFSRRLRVELKKLQNVMHSKALGHNRTKMSDTGRMSVDSTVSEEFADSDAEEEALAFSRKLER
jgi:hypothetical protein